VPSPLDIFGRAADYLKTKPYWPQIEPLFTLISIYAATAILAYEYIQWRYHVAPPLPLYLNSYIFRQVTIVFAAIGLSGILLSRFGAPVSGQLALKLHKHAPGFLRQASIVTVVLALTLPILLYLSPSQVSQIRVKFMDEPPFDKYALTYLIYELNRLQKNWYFEVDQDVFNDAAMKSTERNQCESAPNRALCYGQIISGGAPFIGLATEQLGGDNFFQNHGQVSVISTFRWDQYAPPGYYEFVIHSLIVQSILIHLNGRGALPPEAFRESRTSVGELFQFSPRRTELKAAILAAHLTPKAEELLLNSFGVEYLTTCENLLRLEWLHSERVLENLEKSFKVKL
jgi:hypothetical protein